MAATIRNRHKATDPLYEKTRAKIELAQLINRLNHNALGTLTKPPGKKLEEGDEPELTEMTASQLRSAELLIARSLPILTSTTIEANIDSNITLETLSEADLDKQIAEKTTALNEK